MVIKEIKRGLREVKETAEMLTKGYVGKAPKYNEVEEIKEFLKEIETRNRELIKDANIQAKLLEEGKISANQFVRGMHTYTSEIGKRIDYIKDRLYGKKKLR